MLETIVGHGNAFAGPCALAAARGGSTLRNGRPLDALQTPVLRLKAAARPSSAEGEVVIGSPVLVEMGQPVASLQQLGPALTRCFQAPEGSVGSQITLRFSLNSGGAIIGRPMISYSKLVGSPADKAAFAQEALRAMSACTPVAVTAGFGASIAGRLLSIRFTGGRARSI